MPSEHGEIKQGSKEESDRVVRFLPHVYLCI